MRICRNCGREMEDHAVFCQYCGWKAPERAPTPEPVVVPKPKRAPLTPREKKAVAAVLSIATVFFFVMLAVGLSDDTGKVTVSVYVYNHMAKFDRVIVVFEGTTVFDEWVAPNTLQKTTFNWGIWPVDFRVYDGDSARWYSEYDIEEFKVLTIDIYDTYIRWRAV